MGKRSICSIASSIEERDSELKFRGVRKRKWGKYVSEIRLPNSRERIWLGSYDTAVKAARAFDAAQFCLRGRAGNFNFPDNKPDIVAGKDMTPAEIQEAATRFANSSVYEADTSLVTTEDTVAYSPSISDGSSTVQMESEVSGVEESFYEELKLATTSFGSGNFASEFGFLPEFDYFTAGCIFSPHQQQVNFEFGVTGEDIYDASIYQDSSLWSF